VTVKTKPTHIVSLSPTATEILFSIGAGPQVVAVDDQSNYPATAPKTSLSGFKPNLESIVAEKPDLVVIQFDANGLVAGLKALSVPVIQQPPAGTLDDAYTQMQQLGTLTGNPSGADAAIATMRTKLDTLTRKVTKSATPLTYFHEVDNTLYTATSKTFIGQLYGLLGLTNIADSADKAGSGYPQLSSEYVVSQNPDLIFLADAGCCAQSTKTLAARPGWSGLGAIASNSVIVLDDDLSSRWGPRTPELFETMVNAVAAHSPKPAATSAAK
jgi:iron complex transport system substrate-binding protein